MEMDLITMIIWPHRHKVNVVKMKYLSQILGDQG